MSAGMLDQQVRSLRKASREAARCPSCPDPFQEFPLRAAVMLHTDRDEADRPEPDPDRTEQPRPCPGPQAGRAQQIAAVLAARDSGRDFARRFFLARSQRSQWDFCLDAAARTARDGLELFPRDPELLLTLGSVLEEDATQLIVFTTRPGAPRSGPRLTVADQLAERRRRFGEARRHLTDAVAADPTSSEARVRLGRVQWRLEDDAGAQRTLEEAALGPAPVPVLYRARLFLGQIHERAGRLDAAVREFSLAQGLDPTAQSAAMALAHVSWLSGDREAALRAVAGTLARAGQRATRDPYWDYLASNAAKADEHFERLRDEASE
jgi:tetratricopeptide (TPR) repeat protein